MNLELFNRVNWKEPYHSSGRAKHPNKLPMMYSKWTSLTNEVYSRSCCENVGEKSVLCKFSAAGGKQLAVIIVKQLASNLGITQAAEPSNLTSEKEILWCMEVISYGLTLPLTEQDIVRDCVHVYCEWLSALYPTPKICVPIPVCEDPNFFARKMIVHFQNLFMPRSGEGSDVINKQAVLCHRVLRTLQQLIQTSKIIENNTWQTMLLFLLTINDTLLAPPTIKDDVGDQLCERVLSVLLEVWLIACVKCYPSPPLWKTLREMTINWRHRTPLIEQWNRINLTLTSRILEIMYGLSFPQLKIAGDEELQSTVNSMTEECIVQTWFRMLHTIGNPVDLCRPSIVSQTPQFLQYAITNDNPSEHPCLSVLPLNFYKAIKGIASLVDAFLGTPLFIQWEEYPYTNVPMPGSTTYNSSSVQGDYCSPTPPSRRRLAKSFTVASSKNSHQKSSLIRSSAPISTNVTSAPVQSTSSFGSSSLNYISHFSPNNKNALLSPIRPKCNSILHLFGEWLFEASYNSDVPRFTQSTSGGPMYGTNRGGGNGPGGETGSISSSSSISSFLLRKGSSSQPNSLTTDSSDPDTGTSTPQVASLSTVASIFQDKFVCGRAEAVGTLCRIFCAKKTGEEILPIYLSRFYMIIQQSLRIKEGGECDEVTTSVLLNSAEIFSVDLDGVLLLAPYFIEALEIVLPDRNLKFNENSAVMLSMNNIASAISNSINIPSYSSTISTSGLSTAGAGSSSSLAMPTSTACAPTVPPVNQTSSVLSSGMSFTSTTMNLSSSSSSTMSSADVNTDSSLNLSADDGTATLTPGMAFVMSNAVTSSISSVTSMSTPTTVPLLELRRACIYLLLSLLPLPLHFQNLPLKEFGNIAYRINFCGSGNLTFGQLKPRLINLLISALHSETDSCNTHLLLGGLLFAVLDSVLCDQNNATDVYHGDFINDLPFPSGASDSAHCLLIRSVHLVCHRLITAWKVDLNVSLAALEFLTSVARIKLRDHDISESKRAVKWLCDFIVHQCGRPQTAHSKDLHSSIVAAFQCTSNWLISHPWLLNDKECLNVLLEVVELGISGTKSQSKRSERIRMKDEKELKPVSMRVRDAAEALLTIILEQIAESGSSSISCFLDELTLVKQCATSVQKKENRDVFTYEQAVSKFHYFLLENNVMIALLQEPLGNDQDPEPTITLLIRNSFGRHAWTLQLRHLPRHRSATKQNYDNLLTTTGRPISMVETSMAPIIQQRYFPESINKIESYRVDKSIPLLDDIKDEASDEKLESLIDQQYQAETEPSHTQNESFKECSPPPTCDEFYAARMILSHLGLLSKYRNSDSNKQEDNCLLVALDNNKDGFARELKNLDKITSKTCDTCHIFYVKSGQKRFTDILENTMSKSNVCVNFIELLYSLGWSVRVSQHIGWTGHLSTSYKITTCGKESTAGKVSSQFDFNMEENIDEEICLYDGSEMVLYWCDAISEVAFVVPGLRPQATNEFDTDINHPRGVSVSSDTSMQEKTSGTQQAAGEKIKNSLADGNSSSDNNKPSSVFTRKKLNAATVIMLVWLENFEDHSHFPINELLPYTDTGIEGHVKVDVQRDIFVIFMQAMQNGLLRIKLQGPTNRIYIATPLVDGMIISRRTAGQLIRQTVLNICKRRRLDSDNYQLPHVRRRLKLQEIKEKFETKIESPELLTYLLKNC